MEWNIILKFASYLGMFALNLVLKNMTEQFPFQTSFVDEFINVNTSLPKKYVYDLMPLHPRLEGE